MSSPITDAGLKFQKKNVKFHWKIANEVISKAQKEAKQRNIKEYHKEIEKITKIMPWPQITKLVSI